MKGADIYDISVHIWIFHLIPRKMMFFILKLAPNPSPPLWVGDW